MEGEAGASLLCAVVHCQPGESIKTQQDGAAEGCSNLDHCTCIIIMAITVLQCSEAGVVLALACKVNSMSQGSPHKCTCVGM